MPRIAQFFFQIKNKRKTVGLPVSVALSISASAPRFAIFFASLAANKRRYVQRLPVVALSKLFYKVL